MFSHHQVNSDVVYHKKDKYGNMTVIFVDSNYVGKLVVTKMIGSSDYNDITASYKRTKSKSLYSFTFAMISVLTRLFGLFFIQNEEGL